MKWNELEPKGDASVFKHSVKIGGTVLLIIFVLSILSYIFGWFGEAANVAKKEFGPQAALTKYEWFIDTSKQLDRMSADIDLFEENQAFCSQARDRVILEQCMIRKQETLGVKSAYNDVVADYNAQSRKFNWSMFDTENIQTTYERR